MKLRVINSLVYLSAAVLGIAVIARPLELSIRALTQQWSHTPGLVWPWLWPALALGILLVVASAASRLASDVPAGMLRYGILLALTVLAIGARRGAPTPSHPAPEEAVAHLLARVEASANEAYAREGVYPAASEVLESTWPARLRNMGYRTRGAQPLRSRVLVRHDALEPALRPPPGVRPGDIVYAVDAPRRRYWITAFVLDENGRVVVSTGPGGKALLGSGREGRPASRLDPLFPEYPNKAPMGGSSATPGSGR